MFSRPMNTRLTPARFDLLDKIWQFVAKSIDLDDKADIHPLAFAKFDQAVEYCLPVLIPGKIVVGDKKPMQALGDVGPDYLFDVVRRTPPRFATLHVDDRAERTSERATAAGVKTRRRTGRQIDPFSRKQRH